MSKKIIKITLFISCVIVLLSPVIIPVTVTDYSQLYKLRLGFPFPIIEQHTPLTPMEKDFPFTLKMLDPRHAPTDFLFLNFVISVITVAIPIFLFIYLVKFLTKRK